MIIYFTLFFANMIGILTGIALFMFLVMIHEFGHYFAAKRAKVKVLEFGIGIPPKIKNLFTDKSGTERTVNAIPLGGFVRLKGEDPDHEDFLAPDSFITAGLRKKIIILFAGVFVNGVFAWIAFSLSFLHGVKPINIIPENMLETENTSLLMPSISYLSKQGFLSGNIETSPALLGGVIPDSLASQIGLLSGDVISKINTTDVDANTLGTLLKHQRNTTFLLTYIRNTQTQQVSVTCPIENCLLGVQIVSKNPVQIRPIQYQGWSAFRAGRSEVVAQTQLTRSMLGRLGKNLVSFDRKKTASSVNQMSGPVGIVKMGDMILHQGGIRMYLAFAGIISLGLAIFNLLPIPALDGGRALGVLIQSIFGFKPEKYFIIEGYLNMIVFYLMMSLGIYIILLDLTRFWGVHIPFIG